MNNRKKKIICLFVVFILLLSYSPYFNNLFLNPNFDNDANLRPSATNTLFNGKPYPFELNDFYDDEDFDHIWTGANFSTEAFNDTTLEWSGTINNDTVTPVNNTETQYGASSGVYNGTYDFRDDEVDSEPDGWTINAGDGCSGNIIASKLGHKKVLEFNDNSNINTVSAYSPAFTLQLDGTIELWWAFDATRTTSHFLEFRTYESAGYRIRLYFNYGALGRITQRDLGGFNTIVGGLSINTMYHIKIICNDTANTFDFYVDGDLKGTFDYYYPSIDGVSQLWFNTRTNSVDQYYHWIDALGISGDPAYNSGDNLYPDNINMIKGTYDYTDNMKSNDASYTTFTSTHTDGYIHEMPSQWDNFTFTKGSGDTIGELETIDADWSVINSETGGIVYGDPEYISSITYDEGAYYTGYLSETRVDDASSYKGKSLTMYIKMNIFFSPSVNGRKFRISAHIEGCTSSSGTADVKVNLFINGIEWYGSEYVIDFDNQEYPDPINTVEIETDYRSGTKYLRIYYLKFEEIMNEELLDVQVDAKVSDIDLSSIEFFKYSHKTSISVDVDLDIWNWDTTSWYEIESVVNSATFDDDSFTLGSASPYVSATKQVRVRFQAMSLSGSFELHIDRLRLDYLTTPIAELETTITLSFAQYNEDLLAMNVQSWQRTNISQTIAFKIWNYDTESYVQVSSSSDIAFTKKEYNTELPSDFISPSGAVKLCWNGSNAVNDFELHVDYLLVKIYYKLDLLHTKSFDTNGIYRYRWVVFGSIHYTQWVVFEVVDPEPNFYAISESDHTTRWILQGSDISALEDFHDDINTDYWNLGDVTTNNFKKLFLDSSSYLLDNVSITDEVEYTGTHFDVNTQDPDVSGITWDGTYFWVVGWSNNRVYKYTSAGVYTGTSFSVGGQDSTPWGITWDGTYFWLVGLDTQEVYKYTSAGVYTGTHFDVSGQETTPYGIEWDGTNLWVLGVDSDKAWEYTTAGVYTGTSFSVHAEDWQPNGIMWDGTYFWVVGYQHAEVYKYTSVGVYTGTHFDVHDEDVVPVGITWDGTCMWITGEEYVEVYKYSNTYNISKNYFGSGYMYMQTNKTELISLKSTDYGTHYNLSSGDYFEVDFQTSSDSKIDLILLKDGGVNKTLTLSQSGNTNFDRHTTKISVDEFVEFDQLKVSSTFEDTDNVKVYDIKTYKYTIVGDYADFLIGSKRDYEIYLTPDVYNLRISENGYEKINENITIPATGVRQYVYIPTGTKQCRIAFFNPQDIPLTFTDYHAYVNRSLGGSYDPFTLLENIFGVDVDTMVYIEIKDRFNTLIRTYEKKITPTTDYLDIELEVYQLQIKNLMEQQTTIDINTTHIYPLLSGESEYFMLSKAYYQIGFYDEYNLHKNFTIHLDKNKAYQLNSSLKTIYFSMFTYDGLGIDRDLVRFYINGDRKDLGFNSMLEDTLELIILDFFNNTLANETIDANAYDNSEYNLFVEIYSLIILNQFTYDDIVVNITQVGSGVWMTQIIPKQFGLTYRFLPNVEYNITIYFTNATFYDSRIVNLTTNSHIESFGVPTLPEEYPKEVYFGVYTTTGLGIDRDLVRFYINGDRTDFGFNRIEDMIITLVVKDYFNSTLFNQNVNTSGIYEYNILITLFSLKVKNEARASANYTLKFGGLETTGYILPEEIIEYQLSSNNYVFDYTNNEDNSFHTININLNQDRVYVLNSTYYDTYFSLYDQNGVRLDDSLFSLYLNGTRKDFGFVELESTDVLIVVQDYLNFTAFNSVITLSEFTEYNIIITVFELQVRHLAQENSDLTMYETTIHNHINFSMSPDSLNKYMLSDSTYNITWINGENGLSTTYDITLDENYILTLNTTFYGTYFSLYDLNLHVIDPYQYEFRLNGTIQDFGSIMDLQTDDYNITITDRFGVSLFNSIVTLRGLNEYRIDISLYELQIRHLARENSNLTLTEDISGNDYLFIMTPDSIKLVVVGSADYTLGWTNGENGLTALISIALTEDRVVMLNTSYYNIYFSLYDVNLHVIDTNQYVFKLNGTIQDFGLIVDLQTDDYTVSVADRFGTSLFNDIVTLRGLNEYRIDITLYELQISYLARENGNLTLSETTSHNSLVFNMPPYSLRSFILGSSTYNVTWLNNENGITTTYDINLNSDFILTLNTSYYNIFFSLYDLNLHVIYPYQYEFRLNGTIQDFGSIMDLQTDNYNITVIDRFGTSLFNNIVTLRGLNEYRIDITLYELQIRHLARENSNLILTEDISGNDYSFIMAPNSITSIIVGSADYTLNWTNGENNQITLISIALTEDRVVMLNTSYYNIYFSLYDVNLHVIDTNQYVFKLNGTIQDFGLIVDLQTDDYTVSVADRFGTSLFNDIVTLRGLNEYRIDISLYELQISHLARENGNLTLSETTSHNSLVFNMPPYSLRSFILGSSTYNVTWLNNENGITTTYDINLINDYILTLNTSYYNIRFDLYDLNLHVIDTNQYVFKLNGTEKDFGLIVDLQTDDYTITITDRFGITLFNNIVTLRGLNEYRIDITLYELQISHLARENGNLTLSETTSHNSLVFNMPPYSLRSFVLGSSTYNVTWLNNENGITTTYDINLNSDYILTLNTTYYNIYFSLYDQGGVRLDDSLFSLYINGSRNDFGFIELETNDILILVQDYLNVTVFNQVVSLRGSSEYNIIITVFELLVRHLAFENSNLTLYETTTHNYLNFSMAPDTIRCFMLANSNYNITWVNGENGLSTLYNINLSENYILLLETTYHTIYIGLFTYDGLGLNRDWVRLYINDVRADFGFNVIQSETVNLTVLDYFNNTLESVIIDASAWSEYNLYVEVYSMYILNQFTYTDLIMNITQVGSGYYMAQLIPSASALLYRFIPNLNYTISATYLNGTIYNIRTINLTENSQIESFGVPSAPEEFPKYVWFGVYSFSEININPDLLRFYIDGNRTNFGSNWITDAIITITVRDYFNTTLFNQVINVTGIYEYDILINLNSLKIKNEAKVTSNYTLSYGGLETTGFILPEEIIEYQLSSNNYIFDYTNNEDNSFHTINIILNQDRVYILNTTYYDVYIGLYNFYGIVNREEVKFYIDNIRADFGFNTIKSESVTLTVLDYFNSTLFNQVVTLEGLTEYSIFIRAYTLVVNNLYDNQTITIKITRGTITLERLIEVQGWTEFKLFANTTYEIISYVDGVIDEEKEVELDEEYKTVDFGFYEEEIPDVPDFNAPGIWLMIILILMGCGFAIALVGYLAYRYRKKSENYRRSYADKVTLEAQTIKKFSQGTRIR